MNQILTDEEVSVITGIGFEATGNRCGSRFWLNRKLKTDCSHIQGNAGSSKE